MVSVSNVCFHCRDGLDEGEKEKMAKEQAQDSEQSVLESWVSRPRVLAQTKLLMD